MEGTGVGMGTAMGMDMGMDIGISRPRLHIEGKGRESKRNEQKWSTVG